MKLCVIHNSTIGGNAAFAAKAKKIAADAGFEVIPASRAKGADLIPVLGGDGTVLHAVRDYGALGTPFLGVNTGTLGYLTGTSPDDLAAALEEFSLGKCVIESRALLSSSIKRGGSRRASAPRLALNDVVAMRSDTGRIAALELSVDGRGVTTFLCDGLIIASPTGSTAYSLSAGGPIVVPAADCLVVNVICPHTLSSRPLVVPGGSKVTVRVARAEAPLSWSVDGVVTARLEPGDSFSVTTSDKTVKLVSRPGYDPFAPLRSKLGWNGSTVA